MYNTYSPCCTKIVISDCIEHANDHTTMLVEVTICCHILSVGLLKQKTNSFLGQGLVAQHPKCKVHLSENVVWHRNKGLFKDDMNAALSLSISWFCLQYKCAFVFNAKFNMANITDIYFVLFSKNRLCWRKI